MSPVVAIPVIALASYRLWRLLALDVITLQIRVWLFRIDPEGEREPRFGSALYWLHCPWCSGTWLTALVTLAADRTIDGGLQVPVLSAAAAAALTGLLGAYDPDAFGE